MKKAEIRKAQERSVADVEEQLARGYEKIHIYEAGVGVEISREAAWAATQAIRCSWKLGGRYDGQERLEDGTWLAHVQVPIGRFPEQM